MLEMDGTGLSTASVFAPDVPPPGAGFCTVIDRLAPVATSDAEIWAVTWVLLTNVVVRLAPFTCTTEPGMKLLPVKVRVNAALPAFTLAGEMLASEGAGLLTVNATVPEVPPPGAALATVMEREPGEAMSPARIVAFSCVELTNVVARLEPLTRTVDPLTKFEPLTVRVKLPPPADVEDGEMLEILGTGLVTDRLTGAEVPPPVSRLVT